MAHLLQGAASVALAVLDLRGHLCKCVILVDEEQRVIAEAVAAPLGKSDPPTALAVGCELPSVREDRRHAAGVVSSPLRHRHVLQLPEELTVVGLVVPVFPVVTAEAGRVDARGAVEGVNTETGVVREGGVTADLAAAARLEQRILLKGLEQLEKLRKEYEEAGEKSAILADLSKTASGDAGKEKVEFETYVLGAYFDEVLERANIQMGIMTKGRYELVRRTGKASGKAKGGLDIDVHDVWSASSRPVSTLSGGESFEASLSLAMGLADIVQENIGGVQIDTMFIDEGFGSLDEDALQKAIDALQQVAGSSKSIGIISHVSELTEKIDNQLIVTSRENEGSHVTISNGMTG